MMPRSRVVPGGYGRAHALLRWNLGNTSCRAERCAKHRREMIPAQSARSTEYTCMCLDVSFGTSACEGRTRDLHDQLRHSLNWIILHSNLTWWLSTLQFPFLHFWSQIPSKTVTVLATALPGDRCKADTSLRMYSFFHSKRLRQDDLWTGSWHR